MEVRIGVTYTPKEIEVEVAEDTDRDALIKSIEDAVSSEGRVLWLTDRKGRRYGVPTANIAYVEIGTADEGRRVGFGGP